MRKLIWSYIVHIYMKHDRFLAVRSVRSQHGVKSALCWGGGVESLLGECRSRTVCASVRSDQNYAFRFIIETGVIIHILEES